MKFQLFYIVVAMVYTAMFAGLVAFYSASFPNINIIFIPIMCVVLFILWREALT